MEERKRAFKSHIKKYGISRIQNLSKTFSECKRGIVRIEGDYVSVGQYIYNLYRYQSFHLVRFEMRRSGNGVALNLKLSFICYRMNDYK